MQWLKSNDVRFSSGGTSSGLSSFFFFEEILVYFSLCSFVPLFTNSFDGGKKSQDLSGAHKVHILICLISGSCNKRQAVLGPNLTISSIPNTDPTSCSICFIHITMKCLQRVCAAFAVFKSSSEVLSVSH